jgi:hypothetical protein
LLALLLSDAQQISHQTENSKIHVNSKSRQNLVANTFGISTKEQAIHKGMHNKHLRLHINMDILSRKKSSWT